MQIIKLSIMAFITSYDGAYTRLILMECHFVAVMNAEWLPRGLLQV